MPALVDRAVGQIVGPHGECIEVPTTLIGADAAAILRAAFHWYLTNQLEPELFCANCFDHSRESKAVYKVDDHEIIVSCGCALRYFKGGWLRPDPVPPSMSAAVDATGPLLVTLSEGAARLLRLYKKVLLDLGMKQALRCNACYALDREDGCEAQTTENQILIRCRCSRRVFRGMSM